MSFDYKWCVSPPRGTTEWPAVCDCDIPGHTHIFSLILPSLTLKIHTVTTISSLCAMCLWKII